MQLQRSFVIDSAIALPLITALLFFLGLANESGDAGGLGIPNAFVSHDVWGTVAYGADGLLTSAIFFPFSFYGERGMRWNTVAVVLIAATILVVLVFVLRRWRFKKHLIVLWAILFAHAHIYVNSANDVQDRVKMAEKCLLNQGCVAARVPNRVSYVGSDGTSKEQTGMLLTMNDSFLIMFANEGLFLVPVSNVREIETAKPFPTR